MKIPRFHESLEAPPHLLVVGGGPSGLMAAITAAAAGVRVTLLERQKEPGRKLLATGGGRCNIANTTPDDEVMAAFGRSGRHMQTALESFGLDALRSFFATLGIALVSPDGMHVYPSSGSAREVRDALCTAAEGHHVILRTECPVARLWIRGGVCAGVILQDGSRLEADGVVLATGGSAYPKLGGTGSGYEIVRSAGHAIGAPLPALVPLVTLDADFHALAGVSLAAVEVRVGAVSLRRASWSGALLFTHRGISGPVALNASGAVAEALSQTRTPLELHLNLLPGRETTDWIEEIGQWRRRQGARMLPSLLSARLPVSVATALAGRTGIAGMPCARWTRDQYVRLADLLVGLPLTVVATEGLDAAMVTRGGVLLKEVASRTLESRLVPRLFFAGELLDLDGPCGGYNLRWAFASGRLAGISAALSADVPASQKKTVSTLDGGHPGGV